MAGRDPSVNVNVNIKGRNNASKALDDAAKGLTKLEREAKRAEEEARRLAFQSQTTGQKIVSTIGTKAKSAMDSFADSITGAKGGVVAFGTAFAAIGIAKTIVGWVDQLREYRIEQEKLQNATIAFERQVTAANVKLNAAREATSNLFGDTELSRVIIQLERANFTLDQQKDILGVATSLALEHGKSVEETTLAVQNAFIGRTQQLSKLVGVELDASASAEELTAKLKGMVAPVSEFKTEAQQLAADMANVESALKEGTLTLQDMGGQLPILNDDFRELAQSLRDQAAVTAILKGEHIQLAVETAKTAHESEQAAIRARNLRAAMDEVTMAASRQALGIVELQGAFDELWKVHQRAQEQEKARRKAAAAAARAAREAAAAERERAEAERLRSIGQDQQSVRDQQLNIQKLELELEKAQLEAAIMQGAVLQEELAAQKEKIGLFEIEAQLAAGKISQAEAELRIQLLSTQALKEQIQLRQNMDSGGSGLDEETKKLKSFSEQFAQLQQRLSGSDLPEQFKLLTKAAGAFSSAIEGTGDVDAAIAGIGEFTKAFASNAKEQAIIGSLIEVARSIASFAQQDYLGGALHAAAAVAYGVVAGTTPSQPAAAGSGASSPQPGGRGPSPEERLAAARGSAGSGAVTTNVFVTGTVVATHQQLGATIADSLREARGTGFEQGRRF